MITWDQYTMGYDIPNEWTDTSWGNDELPSYETNGYKIWVNSPDLAERKESQEHLGIKFVDWIFAVTEAEDGGSDLLTTMSLKEVVKFVSKNK